MKLDRFKKRALLICILLTSIAVFGQALSKSFLVEIRMAQSKIKNSEEVTVDTTIRNVSSDEQSLQVWSCSYPEQWITDNPLVHIAPVSCNKNYVVRVRLKPGKVYERTLSIYIGATREKSTTFRLGFRPVTSQKTGATPLIWSNPLKVNITE